MRADNFTREDLPRLMPWLHERGARGYVTFNTLIFQDELEMARQDLLALMEHGVDAAIVQDAGICRLIRQLSPDFPIHASTQMTISSAAGVEFARRLGCQLVVLARECSLQDIAAIRATTPIASMPLEVFVHGALCVAYSGQCLTSEALGGRSANRGECAQACRMPYDLLRDGEEVPLQGRRYLLSPQDLSGLEVLPDLLRLGVHSLKIEGRLKSPEYVASVTQVYRRELDRLSGTPQPAMDEVHKRYRLEMAFSRGLSTGWFKGIDNQSLVHARFGKKRGVLLGEIQRVGRHFVELIPQAPIHAGDGVVFDQGSPETEEQGGRIYQVLPRGKLTRLEFGRGDVDWSRIHPGDRLWKTDDPALNRELRQTFAPGPPRHTRPLGFTVSGRQGGPLHVEVRDEAGRSVHVESSLPLAAARTRPLTTLMLKEQLGRLGGTPFHLGSIESTLEGELMLPVSELNALRRRSVEQLLQQRAPSRWTLHPAARPDSPPAAAPFPRSDSQHRTSHPLTLSVLVRTLQQLQAALDFGVPDIYCEFENPKRHRDAVAEFRKHPQTSGARRIWAAPPRIFKPGEDWILSQIRSAEPDGYLIRNYNHFHFFKGCRLRGDFSLNVANELSARFFLEHGPLERVTASYDLNHQQVEGLLRHLDPGVLELTLHQHMPMFHMEHCVFCAFLSQGKDYRDCGRPCDKHEVRLRDRVGLRHPLKADAGCRNTLFNALAQTGAEGFDKLRAAGARHFRIEFLDESASLVQQTLDTYDRLFRGVISGAAVWQELRVINQLGVTRGTSVS